MGKIEEYIFFDGQEDQPLIPPKKTGGRVSPATKPLGSARFYWALNPRGCVSAWGRRGGCEETIAADGAWPSYFPLLKYFTTIYYFDLAACTLGFHPSSFSASRGYRWFVMPA